MRTIYELTLGPLVDLLFALNAGERSVLYILLLTAAAAGFFFGRRSLSGERGGRSRGFWRFPSFQNRGEALVSQVLRSHFPPPDYHLLNHVTLRMEDGTTQVDHVLVSRYGVFVIETKDLNGWIFAYAKDHEWTVVRFRRKYTFQNPLHQNFRHVLAVQNLLEFIPRDHIKSVVVFCGSAEFKTPIPDGVVDVRRLAHHIKAFGAHLMSRNRMQFCVGRLETSRLLLSGKTDVEHVEDLRRRFGGKEDDSVA